MAAKDGPALFELLRKQREEEAAARLAAEAQPSRAAQPSSTGPGSVALSADAPIRMTRTAEDEAAQSRDVSTPRAAGSDRPLSAAVENGGAGSDGRAMFRWEFSAATLAGAALGLLVLMVGAFLMGRSFGYQSGVTDTRLSVQAAAMSDIDAAMVRAQRTGLPGGSAGSTVSGASGSGGWIEGLDYVVVQEFGRGREQDVAAAGQFLHDHGIETAVVTFPSGSSQLIATRGFDRKDAPEKVEAESFLSRIHELGRKFKAGGGHYHLQGYFKTYAGDRW